MTSPHLRAATDALRADYDATPYKSYAIPQSAPGLLAAIAHLFGLETAEVATARVLEIGCAAAGNIIPFAAAHPEARVVGVDLSPVQIEQGRVSVAAVGRADADEVADGRVRPTQAELRGGGGSSTFNAWHEPLLLSPVDRHLVPLLDGTRDRDALVDALVAVDAENPIELEDAGDRPRRDVLAEQVDTLPQRLAEMKLIRIG